MWGLSFKRSRVLDFDGPQGTWWVIIGVATTAEVPQDAATAFPRITYVGHARHGI